MEENLACLRAWNQVCSPRPRRVRAWEREFLLVSGRGFSYDDR